MVIETNLVSLVETKQVRKVDLNWTCFSVHTRTERYDIVLFQFLVHFSVPSNFWTCFGTLRLIFFHTRVNATPLRTTFWPERNDTVPVWTGPKVKGFSSNLYKRYSMKTEEITLTTCIIVKATSHSTIFDIPMRPFREDQKHRLRFTR